MTLLGLSNGEDDTLDCPKQNYPISLNLNFQGAKINKVGSFYSKNILFLLCFVVTYFKTVYRLCKIPNCLAE